MSDTDGRQSPWRAVAAATALIPPLGSLYAFSVFLQPLESLLGLGRADLAFVFALAAAGFGAGMILAPTVYGLAPTPLLVLACAAVNALSIALAATAGGLAQLAVGYGVLFGVGGGAGYILVQQMVNLAVTGRHGLANGYVVSLLPAGAMIEAPVFGWAIHDFGVRATLGGLAAVLAITGLASAWLVAHSGVTLAAATAYGGAAPLAVYGTTFITATIAAARLGGGWMVDWLAIPTVAAGAHAVALVGNLALTLWPGPGVSVFALALVGMGYGLISGVTAAAVAVYWRRALYGRVASRVYMAWCAAAIVLPIIAGRLFDLTQGYGTAVLIAGGGNALGILVALGLPKQRSSAGPGRQR